MVLTIDVGNSNIVFVFYENGTRINSVRTVTNRCVTKEKFINLIPSLFKKYGINTEAIESSILSSVVPSVNTPLRTAIEEITGQHCYQLGLDVETGLTLDMDNPSTVGHDLIADAVAAKNVCPAPIVVFDTGTATTMSVIDKNGVYIGGLIIPGLMISLDALGKRCAQLPELNFDDAPEFIGKNTVDCMHAGAVFGHAAMIDNLIERTEETLGYPVNVVATGGLMPIILRHCKHDIIYRPDLLTDGLYYLHEKNKAH